MEEAGSSIHHSSFLLPHCLIHALSARRSFSSRRASDGASGRAAKRRAFRALIYGFVGQRTSQVILELWVINGSIAGIGAGQSAARHSACANAGRMDSARRRTRFAWWFVWIAFVGPQPCSTFPRFGWLLISSGKMSLAHVDRLRVCGSPFESNPACLNAGAIDMPAWITAGDGIGFAVSMLTAEVFCSLLRGLKRRSVQSWRAIQHILGYTLIRSATPSRPWRRGKMDRDIEAFERQVDRFPIAELQVEITPHARPAGVSVKTSLLLPGKTLFTGDQDVMAYPAFQRCIRKLSDQLKAYKDELSNKPKYEKHREGTLHDVVPSQEPNNEEIDLAAATGDYAAFRQALSVYDETLSSRAGRLIERHPDALRKFRNNLPISQVVEDVLLTAFDRYAQRPHMRLGQWLESLIEPAITTLATDRDEQENLSFIESAKEPMTAREMRSDVAAHSSVTQPSLALSTFLMYLYSVPRVAL